MAQATEQRLADQGSLPSLGLLMCEWLTDELFDRMWSAYEQVDPWAARGDRAGQPPSPLGRNKAWRAAGRYADEISGYAAAHRQTAGRYLARFIREGNPHHADAARRELHCAIESSTRAAGLRLAVDGWW